MQRVTIAPHQLQHQQISLTDAQIHYLQRVIRLKTGDRFIALDGEGHGWVAMLDKEMATATVLRPWQTDLELPLGLQLIIAMPKTGMDDIVRQTTELGVTVIQPVVSDRTLLKPSPNKVERWRRIAQEAMEQSERQCVPMIHAPVSLSEGLQQAPPKQRWICVARQSADQPAPLLLSALLEQSLWSLAPEGNGGEWQAIATMTLAIGPEGGWTKAEVAEAIAQHYRPVSLGPRILRTVTAPLTAITLMAAVMEHQQSRL